MNKRIVLKAALDGLIQSLILVCLGTFSVSVYASNLSLEKHLLIGASSAALSAFVYVALTLKESDNKKLTRFSLNSLLFFILSTVVIFAIRLTFRFGFMPLREVNHADGILLLFVIGCYILASIVLKICVYIISVIKNIHRKQPIE
ncbi:MAG: hypothetical protein IKK00_07855 [Oscillospiraceae bacterium]|nr:hypothetical protein [Oscillospiraceae bacterium]MBR6561441.1 hypothetical protein [Oscillospiraceae bacterium]